MIIRNRVAVDLTAFHTDPTGDEGRHGHTWRVELVFEGDPFKDERLLRRALEEHLRPYQGKDLPVWSSEDIARLALRLGTGDPIGCIVSRPNHAVEVWL